MTPENTHLDEKRNDLTAYLGQIFTPRNYDEFSVYSDGALIVDKNGTIVAVGDKELVAKFRPHLVYDYGKQLILPGLIDLHVHLVQIAQVGRWGTTLLGWLENYIFPAEASFKDPVHARNIANWFFDQLGANGTTLAAVFTSVHPEATEIAFQIAAERGCRVIMGKMLMDENSPEALHENTDQSLAESEALCKRWHGFDQNRILYAFTPRFAPTSTSKLMKGIAEIWRRYPGTYMQTHLSENTDECAWVTKQFPDSPDYLGVYEQHGLLGKNSLFAHAIHLSESEIKRLKQADAGIAHCPGSNMFLKSGVFPLAAVREAGVKFGLGSDVAAGPEVSMFKVMKDAANIQPHIWLSPAQCFYLATLGAAEAVNLESRVGSLEPGKEADFIVIDPTQKMAVPKDILDQSSDDILSNIVFVGDDRMVMSTFVRGRNIYQAPNIQVKVRKAPQPTNAGS